MRKFYDDDRLISHLDDIHWIKSITALCLKCTPFFVREGSMIPTLFQSEFVNDPELYPSINYDQHKNSNKLLFPLYNHDKDAYAQILHLIQCATSVGRTCCPWSGKRPRSGWHTIISTSLINAVTFK